MSDYNILRDIAAMKDELIRVFSNLKRDYPVPSHLWYIIKHPGIAEGQWTIDNLDNFLTLFGQVETDATAYTVWSNLPDKNPMAGAEHIDGDSSVMKGGTAINITDFIHACVSNVAIISRHHNTIVNLVAFPWRYVIEADPDILRWINNSLVDLIPEQQGQQNLPHQNPKIQEAEYLRVFSSLEKGDLVPSHWQLFLTYNNDTGGKLWDIKRIRTCLEDMLLYDEGNNLNVVWTSEPMHVLERINDHMLRDERGDKFDENSPGYLKTASSINLADFVWLCCQQEEIVYGKLSIIVIMIVLYPLRKAIGDDKDNWIRKTHASMKLIHQATKRHTKH